PPALPVQERALAVQGPGVRGVPPERAGDEGLRRGHVAEDQQRVPEAEDRPLVLRVHLEHGLEQEGRVAQLPVHPELVRLQQDLRGFREVETEGLPQGVDRIDEAARAEQEVRLLVPRLAVRAVQVDHAAVAVEGLRGPLEHDEELGLLEPRGLVLRVRAEVLLDRTDGPRRSSFSTHSVFSRTSRSFASRSETFATACASFARTWASFSSMDRTRSRISTSRASSA